MNEYPPQQMIVIVTHEVTKLCAALQHIKAGQLEVAIERLEEGLDMSVLYLGDMLKKAHPSDQKALTTALKAVRTYWRRHPRNAKTTSLTEIQMTAQKTIDELED